jgi:hypothetical protein
MRKFVVSEFVTLDGVMDDFKRIKSKLVLF